MKIKTNSNTVPFFKLKPGDVFRTADGVVGMKVEDATVNGITINAALLSINRMGELLGNVDVEVFEDATLIL